MNDSNPKLTLFHVAVLLPQLVIICLLTPWVADFQLPIVLNFLFLITDIVPLMSPLAINPVVDAYIFLSKKLGTDGSVESYARWASVLCGFYLCAKGFIYLSLRTRFEWLFKSPLRAWHSLKIFLLGMRMRKEAVASSPLFSLIVLISFVTAPGIAFANGIHRWGWLDDFDHPHASTIVFCLAAGWVLAYAYVKCSLIFDRILLNAGASDE